VQCGPVQVRSGQVSPSPVRNGCLRARPCPARHGGHSQTHAQLLGCAFEVTKYHDHKLGGQPKYAAVSICLNADTEYGTPAGHAIPLSSTNHLLSALYQAEEPGQLPDGGAAEKSAIRSEKEKPVLHTIRHDQIRALALRRCWDGFKRARAGSLGLSPLACFLDALSSDLHAGHHHLWKSPETFLPEASNIPRLLHQDTSVQPCSSAQNTKCTASDDGFHCHSTRVEVR